MLGWRQARLWLGVVAVLCAGATHTASARSSGPVQSTGSIQAAAEHFLRDMLGTERRAFEVHVGRVDRRLRLPECSAPLGAYLPPGGRRNGQVTVGVRCTGDTPWKLFVSARVHIYEEVVIARHPIIRGQVVAASDLARERRDIARLGEGYFVDPRALIGKHARRAISAGELIRHRALDQPKSVRRGQRVVLVARSPGFEVRMEGKALAAGGIGDIIRVRNRRSRRIVEGVIASSGVVHVHM